MTAAEFVKRLAECAPSIEDLAREGYPPTIVSEFHDIFFAGPKPRRTESMEDPLLELVTNYDVSSLTIGMVKFRPAEFDPQLGWIVGKDEADPIVIDRATGEVQLRELGKEWFVIAPCATDSSHFLDAMAAVACFMSRNMLDSTLDDDNEEKHRLADLCAQLAGAPKYLSFYENALGCDIGT
jgi:hypothetical protein